jgi:glycosyltransferase involved in cell wall biosynthesis
MKVSVIIPCYNSHEVFRRQSLNLAMQLPGGWEAIVVDDTSDPPLAVSDALDGVERRGAARVRLMRMSDPRDWTQPIAKNLGATVAQGEFLLFLDMDHILLPGAVHEIALRIGAPCDKMIFPRRYAVLDAGGHARLDDEALLSHGWTPGTPVDLAAPPGVFLVRATMFRSAGWWSETMVGRYQPEDEDFNRRFAVAYPEAVVVTGPRLGVWPDAGKLHSLPRPAAEVRA